MPTLIKTKILVKAALSGQRDKAGVPKYDHCVRVWNNACRLIRQFNITDERLVSMIEQVALLHDIIEDSDITEDDLHVFGFSNAIIDSVKLVTHDEGSDYHAYIDALCLSGNVPALITKLADNIDNTSQERTSTLDAGFKAYLEKRYAGVQPKLRAALAKMGLS